MIVDIYLRAPDRATMDAALDAAGLVGEEGRPVDDSVLLSRIPLLTRPTGAIDANGLPVLAEVEGYHANLRLLRDATDDERAALEAVTIETPAAPYRVWFD